MADDGGIRASDSDRENVVEILRDAYSTGRLTLEEFDERTTAAFAARTWGGLRELTRDLPQQAKLGLTRVEPVVQPGVGDKVPISAGQARRHFSPMLPILVIWLSIALTARAPDAFVPVIVILLLLLRFAGRPGRSRHDDQHRH